MWVPCKLTGTADPDGFDVFLLCAVKGLLCNSFVSSFLFGSWKSSDCSLSQKWPSAAFELGHLTNVSRKST